MLILPNPAHCYRLISRIVLGLGLMTLMACETSVAPSGSTLEIQPATFDVDYGVAGDRTFGFFIIQLSNDKAEPIDGVEVNVRAFFLRVLDADGELVEPGTEVTFTTNDNGQVLLNVEVPFGTEVTDDIIVQSGATSAQVTITISAPSSS